MKNTSPLRAIRLNCLDCMGGSGNEVKLCPSEQCPLYPYRFGKNPNRTKRILSESQKALLVDQLKKARKKKAI